NAASKLMSWAIAPPRNPSVFQSIGSDVAGPAMRATGIQLAGSGLGNGAPLQYRLAGVSPRTLPSVPGPTGAYHAVRYSPGSAPSYRNVSSSGMLTSRGEGGWGTPA